MPSSATRKRFLGSYPCIVVTTEGALERKIKKFEKSMWHGKGLFMPIRSTLEQTKPEFFTSVGRGDTLKMQQSSDIEARSPSVLSNRRSAKLAKPNDENVSS